jgi:hypothetical protein
VNGSLTCRVEQIETPIRLRELDRRSGYGLDVKLVWEPETNCVFVGVIDQHDGDEFALEVDPADALDAFYHPFAYKRGATHDCAHSQPVGVAT